MERFNLKLIEVDKKFYDGCKHKEISQMGIAEQCGIEEIAMRIIQKEAILAPSIVRSCMVYNGTQVCFVSPSNFAKDGKRQQWLSSVFSVSDNGIVLIWFDPDGENKYYRVINQ